MNKLVRISHHEGRTAILDPSTGAALPGVVKAVVTLEAKELPRVDLVLGAYSIEAEGKATFKVEDPDSGKPKTVKSITWADGTISEF